MSYVQAIDLCLEAKIGQQGLSSTALDVALVRSEHALDFLRDAYRDGSLPLLRLPERTDDLATIRRFAAFLRDGASDVVFLGTGGSSLGGQALAQVAGWNVPGLGAFLGGPRVHFLDNLDPVTMDLVLQRLPLATTRFAATSKSGGTGETLMQTIAVLDSLKRAGLGDKINKLMIGISEPAVPGRKNGLRTLLEAHGVEIMAHDPGVGGRYSGLSNVGLLPAAVMGLDIGAIRKGAADVLTPVIAGASAADVPPALGAALSIALAEGKGKTQTVLMAYGDRFERLTAWYLQLWAESIGKNGKGTTPMRALGPVDQHSQLQLFLDGPQDKLFTVLTVAAKGLGPRMDAELAALGEQADFAGKTIGDLVAAQGRATADTFARNGRPVRTLKVEKIDEATIGALMMHFFLETIIGSKMVGVDPFDQPAVEEGKILAKSYMAQG